MSIWEQVVSECMWSMVTCLCGRRPPVAAAVLGGTAGEEAAGAGGSAAARQEAPSAARRRHKVRDGGGRWSAPLHPTHEQGQSPPAPDTADTDRDGDGDGAEPTQPDPRASSITHRSSHVLALSCILSTGRHDEILGGLQMARFAFVVL